VANLWFTETWSQKRGHGNGKQWVDTKEVTEKTFFQKSDKKDIPSQKRGHGNGKEWVDTKKRNT